MTVLADRNIAWDALFDPATPPATLAEIARLHPEYRQTVARHPNAYPGLIAWIAAEAEAASSPAAPVLPAALYRPAATAVAGAIPEPVPALTYEPAPTYDPVPTYAPAVAGPDDRARARSRATPWWIVALVAYTLLTLSVVQPESLEWVTGWMYQIGLVACIAGLVAGAALGAPTVGPKVGAIVLAVVGGLVEYASQFLYAYGAILAVVAAVAFLLSWALARPVRGAGYASVAVLAPLVFVGDLLQPAWVAYPHYVTTSAWLLGLLGLFVLLAAPPVAVACAALWSRGAERRHLVERPVTVGSAPATAGVAAPGATNTMAVLSLVFAFVFSLLAIVFGHIALGQIRRTGEAGRGLAIAGLVLGYTSIAAGVIVTIIYVSTIGALINQSYYY